MLTFLIIVGIIWIILKLLTFAIELPFKVLGLLFKAPFAIIFWIAIIVLIAVAVL